MKAPLLRLCCSFIDTTPTTEQARLIGGDEPSASLPESSYARNGLQTVDGCRIWHKSLGMGGPCTSFLSWPAPEGRRT